MASCKYAGNAEPHLEFQRDRDFLGYAHERTARLRNRPCYAHILAGIQESHSL